MDRVRDEVVWYFILVRNYVLYYTIILGMLLNASVCCYNPVDALKRSIRDVVWLVTPKRNSRLREGGYKSGAVSDIAKIGTTIYNHVPKFPST